MVGKPALAAAMKSGRRGAAMFVRRSGSTRGTRPVNAHSPSRQAPRTSPPACPPSRQEATAKCWLRNREPGCDPVLLYLFRRIEHRLDGWPDPGPAGRGLVIPSARTLLMTVVSCTSLQARLGARRPGGFSGGDRDPRARRRAACGFSLPRATWEDQRKAPDTFPSFADALSRQSRRRDAIASAARFPMRMQSGMPMPS